MVVVGAGPIGVLVGTVISAAGAFRTIIVEKSEFRLSLAQEYGIDVIDATRNDPIEQVREITKGKGADIVFEAVGVPATVERKASLARIRGQVILLGLQKGLVPSDLVSLILKEIEIRGSKIYTGQDFVRAINLVAKGKINLNPLITHRLKLDEIARGFEVMKNPEVSMKVLIEL